MIILGEQYGYRNPRQIDGIEKYIKVLKNRNYSKSIQRGDNKAYCFNIRFIPYASSPYTFETSYFVGVDWIVENELSIHVKPKLDRDNVEVDYVKMLFDILKEPDNYDHLEHLYEINFEKPAINIEQSEDYLTLLLVMQYIYVLKKITQKGLKKSYYTVVKNLNARVKGRILINETLKKNEFNNKRLYNYCQHTEFGINSIENKILKKALAISVAALQHLNHLDGNKISEMLTYIQPAFAQVDSQINVEDVKKIKPNKIYKDYDRAIKFAKLILKKYSYSTPKIYSKKVSTPPFWIDMSKLFELYVFSKLKERFMGRNEVIYHQKFNYLIPDFIIKSNDGNTKLVVDAKYKPQYQDGNVSTEDIRQVSGYARLKKIYEYLKIEEDKIIDCLIIYSSQNVQRKNFTSDNFEFEEVKGYQHFYKIGIELPTKNNIV